MKTPFLFKGFLLIIAKFIKRGDKMYFDAKPIISYSYFKELRFEAIKKFTPDKVKLVAKQFHVLIKLEDIEQLSEAFVQYRFSIENGTLREIILMQDNVAYFELTTKIEEKDEKEFLDYILPIFGVLHYGYLPGKNQSSGLTTRILSTFLDKSENIVYKYGEILEKEEDSSGLSIYTGDNGFYCLWYSFAKNVKIENDKNIKEFFTLKHKWEHVVKEVEKTILINRVKLVFGQL